MKKKTTRSRHNKTYFQNAMSDSDVEVKPKQRRKRNKKMDQKMMIVIGIIAFFLILSLGTFAKNQIQSFSANRQRAIEGEIRTRTAEKAETDNQGNRVNNTEAINVYVLNVGNGDASLIDCGDFEVLIDTGDAEHGKVVSKYLDEYVSDKNLEYLILTGSDPSSAGGINEVINRFKVENLIYGYLPQKGLKAGKPIREAVSRLDKDENVKVSKATNQIIELGNSGSITVFGSEKGSKSEKRDKVATTMLTYGNYSALFTGNATEDEMKESVGKIDNDVGLMVAPHQGRYASMNSKLLYKLSPRFVVISSAKAPSSESLDMYKERSTVLCTYEKGAVKAVFENSYFNIE